MSHLSNNSLIKANSQVVVITSAAAIYLIVAVLYAGVPYVWALQQRYSITGDEPHYLMISDSLLRDCDLDVTNNYASEEAQYLYYRGPMGSDGHVLHRNGKAYSVHGLGVPLAIALPTLISGRYARHAARVGLAVINAAIAPLLFLTFCGLRSGTFTAFFLTLAITFAMPFITGANQIFPDMLAGTAALACVTLIQTAHTQDNDRDLRPVVFILVASVLPFLHIKYSAAPVLLGFFGLFLFPQLRGPRSWVTWTYIAIPCVLGGIFLTLNQTLYGSILGPYAELDSGNLSVKISFRKNVAVLLALLFDQAHGMMVQQPLFWLSFFGLGFLATTNFSLALLLVGLIASLIVPNALHPVWFGGWSFVGRFAWPSAPLLAFLSVYGLMWLSHFWGSRLVTLIVSLSVAYQIYAIPFWMTDGFLIQRSPTLPPWLYNSVLPQLVGIVPSLYMDPFTHFSPKAFFFVATAVAFVIAGALCRKRETNISPHAGGVGLAILTALAALPTRSVADQRVDVPASSFATICGDRIADGLVTRPALGNTWLAYGPFWRLPPGQYRACWHYSAARSALPTEESSSSASPHWDFCVPLNVVRLSGPLFDTEGVDEELSFVFQIDNTLAYQPVEFRVHAADGFTIKLNRFSLERIE